jgi:hypothetical protein
MPLRLLMPELYIRSGKGFIFRRTAIYARLALVINHRSNFNCSGPNNIRDIFAGNSGRTLGKQSHKYRDVIANTFFRSCFNGRYNPVDL